LTLPSMMIDQSPNICITDFDFVLLKIKVTDALCRDRMIRCDRTLRSGISQISQKLIGDL